MMEVRELSRAPAILPLYARAAAPLLPGSSLLPFIGARGGEIPELELTLADVAADPDRLAAYAHVCGLSLRETLPASYPHVLAFPLQLALMADRSFPFGAVGLVHIANRIVLRRPIHVEERLRLRVHASRLREHPRGSSFSLVSQAYVDDELVWDEDSTMLRRGAGSASHGSAAGGDGGGGAAREATTDSGDAASGAIAEAEAPAPSAQWRLPGDLGRRYAAVSGDRNPIHMHPLTAKALGFPRAIAHGMWTKARCLAALEGSIADTYSVEVRFRRPIAIPATVAFHSASDGEAVVFGVRDARYGTPHLDGKAEPIDAAGGCSSADEENGRESKERGGAT